MRLSFAWEDLFRSCGVTFVCGWILIGGVDSPRILLYSRSLFIVSQNFLDEDFMFDLQIFSVACVFLIHYTRKEYDKSQFS